MLDQHGNTIPVPDGTTAYLTARVYNTEGYKTVAMRYQSGLGRENILTDNDGEQLDFVPDAEEMILSTKDVVAKNHNASVLYPNPSSGTVYYNDGDHQSHEKFQYVLYNTAGQKI